MTYLEKEERESSEVTSFHWNSLNFGDQEISFLIIFSLSLFFMSLTLSVPESRCMFFIFLLLFS